MQFAVKLFLSILAGSLLILPATAADPIGGWRGNGTGLWPDSHPPLEWQRIPKGALENLRESASRPKDTQPGDAPLVEKGLIRNWLVLGPFPVEDSVKQFDEDLLGGETAVEPSADDKLGDKVWKPVTVPPDDIMVFGTASLASLDLVPAVGFKVNQLAYAHTYLYSPRGGWVRVVVDHAHGLKAWVNGKEVYRQPQRRAVLGYYTHLSRLEMNFWDQASGQFECELQPGWNRLLLKLSTSNKRDWTDFNCSLRIMDQPDVPYESKNILWMTELPDRSTSTPIIVGDRIFVAAEPDELLCLDKNSGRILWTASHRYYETLTVEERQANPAFRERVAPLIASLGKEADPLQRGALRRKLKEALSEIDAKRFDPQFDGHFEAHFGIVGYTMPTPVCDGTYVYYWCGNGVAACYDLAGKREWITRIEAGPLTYASTPTLVDGVLVVFLNHLFGLDAKTGKLLWEQPRIHHNVASLLPGELGGKPTVVTQRGEIVRPSDGELLMRPRNQGSGDTGWSPGVILGNTLYQPKYGIKEVTIFDFTDVAGDEWEPKVTGVIGIPEEVNRGPGGKWMDLWTAASPLIHGGLIYQVDMYQTLYVFDIKTRQMIHRRQLPLHGFTHYNALAVAASPTLIGNHIFILDNQGTTLVFEPGRECKQVAANHIGTVLSRSLPLPGQEILSYAPPIADGNRLYLRGERYLYCIGEK